MVNAALALQFSDDIESILGLRPTKEEQANLTEKLPRVTTTERKPA